ncbi:hypothetical protein A1O3_02764 [Capronia epimyces CBS 606.96]|uniref:Zn(2)-C6 fungal-type domain-containing protein n=1 Tax=Capronia epimyces CBS 606.96 TaxID=1182542 RepID=W9YA09_9EURO|nr:uncharacterized protein A1O3_02764 [Capronia epimyces CBS 606.96]EXJ89697.1 hypothetical protein A1O3_02764 [Capronia epimyces CBS 606.96]
MPYTSTSLRDALLVYREARVREILSGPSTNAQRHLRNDYSLRQVVPSSTLRHAVSWQEDESSADEYNPTQSRKRRVPAAALKTPKRAKRVHTTTRSEHLQQQSTAQQDIPLPGLFVTLKFKSDTAKKMLRDLAQEHGTGCVSVLADRGMKHVKRELFGHVHLLPEEDEHHKPIQATVSYLHRLDEDSLQIDNSDGRVLRSRKILDRDVSPRARKCGACKASKRKCSLLVGKNNLPPCTRCHERKLECVVDNVVQQSLENSHVPVTIGLPPTTPAPPAPPAPPATASQILRAFIPTRQDPFTTNIGASQKDPIVLDSPPPSPGKITTGRIVKVTTFWAHPIDFKHIPTPQIPCHFCADFRYGIFGYGELTVEVIQYPNSNSIGYEETGDGHRAQGHEATRMCVNCALNRMYISRCGIHRFKQRAVYACQRLAEYRRQVLAEPWEPPLKAGVCLTCSLCSNAALWRCCSMQRFDKFGRALSAEDGHDRGCGLILCDLCYANVAPDGVLRRPIRGSSRADIEFLFSGSLVHKAYGE